MLQPAGVVKLFGRCAEAVRVRTSAPENAAKVASGVSDATDAQETTEVRDYVGN